MRMAPVAVATKPVKTTATMMTPAVVGDGSWTKCGEAMSAGAVEVVIIAVTV